MRKEDYSERDYVRLYLPVYYYAVKCHFCNYLTFIDVALLQRAKFFIQIRYRIGKYFDNTAINIREEVVCIQLNNFHW